MAGISIPPAAGIKNKIINGDCRSAQRGTSIVVGTGGAANSSNTYTLDRWQQTNDHDANNITVTQDSSVPNNNFQYSLKVTNAAGSDTSIGTNQYCLIQHKIEGYNIVPLRLGKFTISFWVKSNKTGTYSVAFRNWGGDRVYAVDYSINSANTWEFKNATVDLSAVSGGTWYYDNSLGLGVVFGLACGSGLTVTPGSWQSLNKLASSNQVNWLNEQNNTFYLTGVQLEKGDAPTEFESRDFGTELRMCQRYYWKLSYDSTNVIDFVCCDYSGSSHTLHVVNPDAMRALPAGGYSSLSDFYVYEANAGLGAPTALAYYGASPMNGDWIITRAGGTAGRSSMLRIVNVGGYLSFDAEL